MAEGRSILNIEKDLTGNLQRDLNFLVRTIISDLSNQSGRDYSPVDTGFFASSWTASTQRPRPDQSRKKVAPWSNIKSSGKGTRSPGAVVDPRFIDTIKYDFKTFSKVFIGNRSQYAARALASPRSKVPQYVQGQLRPLIDKVFNEKPKLGIATFGSGIKGQSPNVRKLQGFGLFGGVDDKFVDYIDP
tara:strand:- start:23 stop:586 length:564 start_codon:yes stop_codon:yes gene_type:complete